jgi:hypothetical protein
MPELQTRGCRVITLVIFSPVDLVKQPEDNIRVGFSKMAFVLQTQNARSFMVIMLMVEALY